MMVRREVIRKRLQRLEEYLQVLETLAGYSESEFLASPERYGSAERFLQLAIEATIDIGNHIVADLQLGQVEVSRDVAYLLADAGKISPELRERWIRMIGFRNILVHDYLDIDRHIVYEVLQNHLDDLRLLMQTFATFL